MSNTFLPTGRLLIFVAVVLWMAGFSSTRLSAQRASNLFKEVALISTSSETDVLRDLLTVNLSEKGFSLVARQEMLTALANERGLAAIARQAGAGQRARVGRLVRADVLVIMRHDKNEAGDRIEVVVAETKSGTRIGKLSFRDDDVDVLLPLISDEVVRLRDLLSDGIKQIVAIPPFVSNNLGHDLDDLQATISNYLAETLRETPGFVVVEFKEANAILAENALHPDEVNRKIPLIVNGQFSTPAKQPDKLEIAVTLDLGERKIEIADTVDYLAEKPETLSNWLRETLASRIAALAEQTIPAVTPAEQVKTFVVRADEFASLGDVDKAIALREAVLVLDPGNVVQRKQLVREYSTHINLPWATPRHLRHFEFLARNKMLSDRLELRRFHIAKTWASSRNSRKKVELPEQMLLDEVRFCVAAAKAWHSLPDGEPGRRDIGVLRSASGKAFPWWNLAAHRIWENFAEAPSAEMLQLQADFLEQYPVDELPCGSLAIPCSQGTQTLNLKLEQIDRKDWDSYFERLEQSPNPTARYAGNLSRIYYFLWHAHCVTRLVPRAQVEEFRRRGPIKLSDSDSRLLRASVEYCIEQLPAIRKLEKSDQGKRWEGWSLYRRRENYTFTWLRQIDLLFKSVDHYFPDEKFASRVRIENDPLKLYGKPAPREEIVSEYGRLEFAPIELSVEGTLPKVARRISGAGLQGLTQCGDFDVLWTSNRVFLMKKPGVLEPLDVPDWYAFQATMARVSWDGRFVWLSSGSNSLFILDSADWRLHEVDALPEKDQMGVTNHNRIVAHCFETGRAIAVGSFGKNFRAWCAEISVQENGEGISTSIDVFHTAKTVAGVTSPESKIDPFDPQLAFVPRMISLVETKEGEKRILVKRMSNPLMINPEDKEVSVLRHPTYNWSLNHIITLNGDLFVAYNGGTSLYCSFDSDDAREIKLGDRGGNNLIEHEGWIYSFGGNYTWDRINVETLEVEPLATMVPHPHRSNHCAVSTHHGLVAFGARNSNATSSSNDDLANAIPNLYQMVIKDKPLDK